MAAANQPVLSFVAAHGTGTPLGDPIETGAVCRAAAMLQQGDGSRDPQPPVPFAVAGVKTLLGHTEGTAGLTGLLLAAATGTHASAMPLRYRSLNPFVRASLVDSLSTSCRLPLQVCASHQPWQSREPLAKSCVKHVVSTPACSFTAS